MFKYLQHIPINNRPIINNKIDNRPHTIIVSFLKMIKNLIKKRGYIWYIKISIASNVAIKYKGDTPIKYYGDV